MTAKAYLAICYSKGLVLSIVRRLFFTLRQILWPIFVKKKLTIQMNERYIYIQFEKIDSII